MANSGLVCTLYPAAAAGTALKASGNTTGAYKFAAAGANVKAVVAKATITTTWQIVSFGLDTFSATSIFVVRFGNGAAAAAAMTTVQGEIKVTEISAVGVNVGHHMGWTGQTLANGTTDGVLFDMASSNAAADDTANVHVSVLVGFGAG